MQLNEIRDNQGARKRRMRVGRGLGSGKGKTCGRGGKGQTARSGVAIKGFEGGQMPIHRRLPKRGFHNISRVDYDILTLRDLQVLVDNGTFKAGDTVTTKALVEKGIVPLTTQGVKILFKGELKAKLNIDVERASKNAQDAISRAGGSIKVQTKLPRREKVKKDPKTGKAIKA